jgi:hypothetical protein
MCELVVDKPAHAPVHTTGKAPRAAVITDGKTHPAAYLVYLHLQKRCT